MIGKCLIELLASESSSIEQSITVPLGWAGHSLSVMAGLQRVPSSFFSCTRTRPSTHHCREYDFRCGRSHSTFKKPFRRSDEIPLQLTCSWQSMRNPTMRME